MELALSCSEGLLLDGLLNRDLNVSFLNFGLYIILALLLNGIISIWLFDPEGATEMPEKTNFSTLMSSPAGYE